LLHFGSRSTKELLIQLNFPNPERDIDGSTVNRHYLILRA
jgi:hypothetical protein